VCISLAIFPRFSHIPPAFARRLLAAQAKDSTDPATLLDDIPAKWPIDDWCRPPDLRIRQRNPDVDYSRP